MANTNTNTNNKNTKSTKIGSKNKKTKQSMLSVKSYKYIPCTNVEFNDSTWWFGRLCDNFEVKVDSGCIRVLCGTCIAHITSPGDPALRALLEKERTSTYPRGWKLYKEFVDENGNVFHKGVEVPDLKGTIEPTKIEVGDTNKDKVDTKQKAKPKSNTNKVNKLNDIDTTSIKIRDLKKLLKIAKSQKEKDKITKQIIKLEKEGYRNGNSK